VSRRRLVGPGLVLLLAAALRFAGLTWGLPHRPSQDELAFIDNAWHMRVSGHWDPRYYQYPGLVFDLLAAAYWALPAANEAPPLATAIARGLVAAFGVVSVGLVYRLGNRLLGRRAGLFAAALLAVSPVEVETAHMARPDVILETFVLAAFLALSAAGRSLGPDVGAGLALGAALATKFTGLLLAPVYVVGRLLGPAGSPRRLALGGLLALLVLVTLTPALLLNAGAFLAGVREQWAFHYTQGPTLGSWARLLAFYGGVALRALGPVGLMLAVAGIVLGWGDLRSWLPVWLFPAGMVAVLATAVIGHDRLLVPALGLLTLLAAGAYDATAERRPGLGVLLAVMTLSVPLAFSLLADVRYLRATPYDRALSWLETRPQARVFVLYLHNRLKIDSARFRLFDPAHSLEQNRLLARHFDLVAASPGDPMVAGFHLERAADPDPGWPGPRWPLLAIFSPGPLAPRYTPVDLTTALLTSSTGAESLAAAHDGEPDTAWTAPGDAWLQIDLPTPIPVGRVTAFGAREGCPVGRVWVMQDAGTLREPTWVALGPSLLLEPIPVRALRLAPAAGCAGRFMVAELRLEAAAP
jgi:4-amino-4-deoxy-L-arabinose transferase-like glycosyltransferase